MEPIREKERDGVMTLSFDVMLRMGRESACRLEDESADIL